MVTLGNTCICDQQGESNLYVGSAAWAALAVLAEPVRAQGLVHRILDHLLPKALLHELFPLVCGRQVLVFEATEFIWGRRNMVSTGVVGQWEGGRGSQEMQTLPARNLHLERPW